MKDLYKIFIGTTLIYFFTWFSLYKLGVNTLPIQSEDTVPAMFLPFAIIKENSLYLDSYYSQMLLKYPQPDDKTFIKGNVPFYIMRIEATPGEYHYLSAFTIITPILSVPVYVIPVLMGAIPTWEVLIILSHLSAAVIMALSGVFLFQLLKKRLLLDRAKALIVTIIYLFGTVNFALISQAMWQHGSVQLLLLAGLYFLLDKDVNPKKYFFTSLFWGFAFLARPTAIIPIACLIIFSIISQKDISSKLTKLLLYGIGLLPSIGFFLWYNSVFYKSIENQGYTSQLLTSWVLNPLSFLGVWISPSKGILIYSPIMVFALIGLYLAIKNKGHDKRYLYGLSGAIVLLHTVLISLWKHWYGGWSFGYRMSSDILPFMVLLIVPFIESNSYKKYKKVFYFLLIFSIFVEILGIVFFDGVWHAAYDKGFHNTAWLWSIVDSEAVFNIRRVLVKIGLLYNACSTCLPK